MKNGICPLCGKDLVVTKRSYCCSNWKGGCGFTIWKNVFGHEVSEEEALRLTFGEQVGPVDMKTKAGTNFRASLKYDADKNKIVTVYQNKRAKA